MKTVGIIAEFNPFHNGHEYIIRQARRLADADFCVVVMSGDFVQRGEPAICDKYTRTKAAILSGADAVFEIPSAFCCGSAEQFAFGSAWLLSSLGCIDEIWFGSEYPDLEMMMKIAQVFVEEPAEYRDLLSIKLKEGLNFPSARQAALTHYLQNDGSDIHDPSLLSFILNGGLSSPNNILGIEYCKSIIRLSLSGIQCPLLKTLERMGSKYDSSQPDTPTDASASAIRRMFSDKGDEALSDIRPYVPESTYDLIFETCGRSMPIFADDLSSVLFAKLQQIRHDRQTSDDLEISADLFNSILNNSEEPVSFTELAEAVKSRNNTLTSIYRALLSLMLDLGRIEIPALPDSYPYARLLGFRRDSSELIKAVNAHASCEVINKLADAKTDSPLLACDIRAARLYNQIVYQKYGTRLTDEYRKTVEIF